MLIKSGSCQIVLGENRGLVTAIIKGRGIIMTIQTTSIEAYHDIKEKGVMGKQIDFGKMSKREKEIAEQAFRNGFKQGNMVMQPEAKDLLERLSIALSFKAISRNTKDIFKKQIKEVLNG